MDYRLRDRILDVLQEPMTIATFSKKTKMKYHTARKRIQILVKEGSVVQLLWQDERKNVYQTIGSQAGGMYISVGNKATDYLTAIRFLGENEFTIPRIRNGLVALAYESYKLNHPGMFAYAGGITPGFIREVFIEYRKVLRDVLLIMDQVVADKKLWVQDNPDLYKAMGISEIDHRHVNASLLFEENVITPRRAGNKETKGSKQEQVDNIEDDEVIEGEAVELTPQELMDMADEELE